MTHSYDVIIWGASLEGMEKALELNDQGLKVLLLNKFGFPGGNATEALTCLYNSGWFSGNPFRKSLLRRIYEQNYGVIYNQDSQLVVHPEAVKRAAWEVIAEGKLEVLFHVTPLKVDEGHDSAVLTVFGREGMFTLKARELRDFSDNQMLVPFRDWPLEYHNRIRMNCFFRDMTPAMEQHFAFERVVQTDVGYYTVFQKDDVPWHAIERQFNKSLDELAVEGWKNFGVRMLIMPVYPELVMKQMD